MALYRRGNYWWVNLWINGRHVQKSTKLKDKRMARAVEQALYLSGTAIDGSGERLVVPVVNDEGKRRGLVLGLLKAVYGDDSDRTPLASVWDEYLDTLKVKGKQLEHSTLRDKRGEFESMLKWAEGKGIVSLDEVTAAVAKSYSLGMVGKVSEKRRSNVIRDISSVWNALLPAHPGITNPWPAVAPSVNASVSSRRAFTREEERRVLDAAKRVHRQWYIACIIARHTGLRYGDVCRLTWGNVDMEAGVITVCPHKTMRSSKAVVRIPMTAELATVIGEWRTDNARVTEYDKIMPWMRCNKAKGKHRFRVVLEAAGLDPKVFTFHTWRHTLSTRLGEVGVSVETRKKILGHTTDLMAERYNHADITGQLKAALEAASVEKV